MRITLATMSAILLGTLACAERVVDIGPGGSFDCASPHPLVFGEVGNVDADPADEVVSWGAPQAPFIHDLSW